MTPDETENYLAALVIGGTVFAAFLAVAIAAALAWNLWRVIRDPTMRIEEERYAPEAEADHRREAWIKFRDNNSET